MNERGHPYQPTLRAHRAPVSTNYGQQVDTEDFTAYEDYEEAPPPSHTGTRRHQSLTTKDWQAIQKQGPQSLIRYRGTIRPDELPFHLRRKKNAQPYQIPQHAASRQKRSRIKIHWTVYLIAALILLIAGGVGIPKLLTWWSITQDDWKYGRPRLYQCDAVVGHGGDSATSPTHFLALNLRGNVKIIEFPGGDASKAINYRGPQLFGEGKELLTVTLSSADVNGDHRPDMVIIVGGTKRYILINDKDSFRLPKQNEPLNLP